MRKVAKKVCKLSLFSQLSAPIKSGVTHERFWRPPIYYYYCCSGAKIRAHLIGLKNICFQKIKNQSFHLIGRSVSTPRMVILKFRKFCFQPRSPGGLFLRNYICFIRSSCGLPHRVSQTSSHSTGTSISPETHTRTHGQARTVACRGSCLLYTSPSPRDRG